MTKAVLLKGAKPVELEVGQDYTDGDCPSKGPVGWVCQPLSIHQQLLAETILRDILH